MLHKKSQSTLRRVFMWKIIKECVSLFLTSFFICLLGLILVSSFVLLILGTFVSGHNSIITTIETYNFYVYLFGFLAVSILYIVIFKWGLHIPPFNTPFYRNLFKYKESSLRFHLMLVNLSSYLLLGYLLFYELGLDETNTNKLMLQFIELGLITLIIPFTTITSYYLNKVLSQTETSLTNNFLLFNTYYYRKLLDEESIKNKNLSFFNIYHHKKMLIEESKKIEKKLKNLEELESTLNRKINNIKQPSPDNFWTFATTVFNNFTKRKS